MGESKEQLIAQLEELRRHNTLLESQLRQRTFELEVLNDLSQQIGYSLNYDDLSRLMLQHLHRVVPYVVSGSFIMLEEPYDMFIQYTRPLTPALQDDIRQRMVSTLAHMKGQTIRPSQIRVHSYEVPGTEAIRFPVSHLQSVFQVPLIVGPQREVIGVLFVGAERADMFHEGQVRILYTVANQASIAVQQLQALLAAEEQRIESMVEHLPDGVLLLDAERRIVLSNPSGQEYLTLLAPGIKIGDILSHIALESLEMLLQPYPIRCHEVEIGNPKDELSYRVFEIDVQPINMGPQAGGWTLVIRNITGRKRAEEEVRQLNDQLEQRIAERTTQLETANHDLQQQILVREQAEEDLRRERDLLHSIMETSPVGILVTDSTGAFSFANPRAETVLGLTEEQIQQRTCSSPEWKLTDYHGIPIAKDQTIFDQILASGQAIMDTRYFLLRSDGKRVLLSLNGAPLYDTEGNIERVVLTVRDVTRRVQDEQALRLSETKLRLITTQLPSILWTTDTTLLLTDVLGSGLNRQRNAPLMEAGQSLYEIHETSDNEAPPIAAHFRALRGLSAGYEIHLHGYDFEVRVDPLRDDEGQIVGCIALAQDITERKQIEEHIRNLNTELEQRVVERTSQLKLANEELHNEVQERVRAEQEARRSQLFLNSILENIPDVIFVKDAQDFRFVLFNRAAEKLIGQPREQMIGKDVLELFGKEVAMLYFPRDQAVVQSGVSLDIPEEIVTFPNEDRFYHTRLLPILDEKTGNPVYILGICADVTERKRAEAELQQAWQAAQAATQAKSEFLANMSHEIRTPLNAIIGMSNLLFDTNLDKDQFEFARTIRLSSHALLAIINDVLDFSKIEAGKLELHLTSFNLQECIQQSLELVAAKAAEKQLEMVWHISEGTPTMIIGDPIRLRQILVNLLSNAVKFTESGTISVTAGLHDMQAQAQANADHQNHNEPLATFLITVQDTGIGIPQDRINRLFQSFSQVDSSSSRRYGGTGLGLAISKNLAELMQGKMWVESEFGKGTTFFFTFMARVVPEEQPPGADQGDPMLSTSAYPDMLIPSLLSTEETQVLEQTTQLSGKHVLIVDDYEPSRRLLTRQIGSWGMMPCVVSSTDDALCFLSSSISFDGIVLNIQLNQDTVLKLLQTLPTLERKTIPPLIICGIDQSQYSTLQQQPTISLAFLDSPIKPSQLYNVLISVLGDHLDTDHIIHLDRESYQTTDSSSQASPPHPLRILLVEDNLFNQKVALRYLEKIGYYADVAANGHEALNAMEHQQYDVVLMDIQMPGMDGIETTQHIRQWGAEKHQPHIIAMTAHAMRGDRERCLEAGMDNYVSKPIQLDELAKVLSKVQT